MKRLFIDTETGGLDPKTSSLLTVGLTSWSDGVIYDSFEFMLKSDVYKISAAALEVNRIDLTAHDKIAMNLKDFSDSIFSYISRFEPEKIWMAGHNVQFDRAFLFENIPQLRDRFHYRLFDTSAIIMHYIDLGLIPESV